MFLIKSPARVRVQGQIVTVLSQRICFQRLRCGLPEHQNRGMKRATKDSKSTPKPKPKLPDYTDAEPVRDDNGEPIWPATAEAIEKARAFVKEW